MLVTICLVSQCHISVDVNLQGPACLFNTVIGINCALVVYQYLYVASYAADDIVYVEDFWFGV